MIKLALIGHPLSHSLSKVIHEAAMRDLHIIGTYDLLDTEPENLINQVKYLKSQNYLGFNVTIPHKVPISLFLDKVDNNADIALCANTVKIDSDKNFYVTNFDGNVNCFDIMSIQSKNRECRPGLRSADRPAKRCRRR